jgi:hypothetical protein
VLVAPDDLVATHQLGDAVVEPDGGPEPGLLDPLVAHEIVALVGILADLGGDEVELGNVLANDLAQLPLAEVGVAEPDIVRPALHEVVVGERMPEHAGAVAHVQVVPLEVRLEQDQESVDDGPEGEVVHQEVQPHPRADSE